MEPVRFSTLDGVSLEGELRVPESPRGSAVLCHAHPRFGGSKDHPILWAIRNDLAQRGFAVLAFNFRGTMRSGGTYGGGRQETEDVVAAIGRVREEAEGPTVVVGWSFGAGVALREALTDERVAALALIGVPLRHDLDLPPTPSSSELGAFRRPVLLLAGEHDAYSPEALVRDLAGSLPNAEVAIVAGTDHYLWRHERKAAAIVGAFAQERLD
ncbi:MAG TPA: alpha/beta fold hydrolase [Actinomycetota bacterium]